MKHDKNKSLKPTLSGTTVDELGKHVYFTHTKHVQGAGRNKKLDHTCIIHSSRVGFLKVVFVSSAYCKEANSFGTRGVAARGGGHINNFLVLAMNVTQPRKKGKPKGDKARARRAHLASESNRGTEGIQQKLQSPVVVPPCDVPTKASIITFGLTNSSNIPFVSASTCRNETHPARENVGGSPLEM